MSAHIKRTIPLLIIGLTGLLMVADFTFVSTEIASGAGLIRDWVIIIAGFALCLGAVNLFMVHGRVISKRTPNRWYYSVVLVIVMFSYVIIGLTLTTSSTAYAWLFNAVNIPMAQIIWSLMAFYCFSAAVRAFQARNWDAAFFLASALLVVVGNIPSTPLVSPELAAFGPWITYIPTKGAFRGLLIAAAVGGLILGMRTLLGREKSSLGGGA